MREVEEKIDGMIKQLDMIAELDACNSQLDTAILKLKRVCIQREQGHNTQEDEWIDQQWDEAMASLPTRTLYIRKPGDPWVK